MGYIPTFGGRARAVVRLLFVGAGVLLLITACSRPGQASPQSQQQQMQAKALAYARCMRSHGVSDYPDPTFTNGGVTSSYQGDPNSPTYKAAQQACKKYQPGPGSMSPQQIAKVKADELQTARCMRTHGFPNFPDPNSQGVIQLPSSIDTTSSTYQSALKTCRKGSMMISQGGGPGSGSGGRP